MNMIEDFAPVLHRTDIEFIRLHQEDGDVVSFEFKKPAGINWKAGQHGIFTFPDKHIKGMSFRGFSITTSPHEKTIRIATRISDHPSDFKEHLMHLHEGDIFRMRGPFGPFHLIDSQKPAVFIVGGIGITPVLGLLHEFKLNTEALPPAVRLVYGSSDGAWPFMDEINELALEIDVFEIDYAEHRDELHKEIAHMAMVFENEADYFVSGSGKATRFFKRLLRQHGIKRKNIHSDWFLGY